MCDLALRELHLSDEASFRRAVTAFATCDPEFEFAFHFDRQTNFRDYVRMLENSSRGENLPEGFVPSTFFVGVVGDEIVGRLSIRHTLTPFLAAVGGHIGYGVVPGYRRKR